MGARIERLDFAPWGCFEDFSLNFSTRIGDVDLVYGPNAAGKSTTSRGERSLLYGIDARTSDNHTFDYGDLRIGAKLLLDGTGVELARRKRRAGSLIGADGEPLPDDTIARALGGLTQEVYRALFQVDHDTLVQGGAELLQGRGEVGASLFAAAAGIATLHDTLAALDGEADRIFNPRGRTTVLHKALAELRDAEKRLRATTLRPARHREMSRALLQAEEACEELSRRIRDLELKSRAIERKCAIAPLLDRHAERTDELSLLASTPDLPEDCAGRRADAQGRVRAGNGQLQRKQTTIDELAEELAAVGFDDVVLARGDDIREVKDELSAIRKAAEDRPKRETELQMARASLRQAAETIGVQPEEVDALRRPAIARKALDGYLSERDELVASRRAAEARVREMKTAHEEAVAGLDDSEPVPDVDALAAATTAALRSGALPARISETRAEASRLREQAEHALQRLVPAPSTVAELRVLPVPTRETIVRAQHKDIELGQLTAALRSDDERLGQAEAELAHDRDELKRLGDPPTAEDLSDTRTTRDEFWAAVRADVDLGSAPGSTVVSAFEHAAAEADHVADARIAGASEIERAASVQARDVRLEREREHLGSREKALAESKTALAGRWKQRWARTGLALIGAHEALAWLDQRDRVLELDDAASQAETKANALADQEAGHITALRDHLKTLGVEATGAGLEQLTARAQAFVDDARQLDRDRSSLASDLKASKRALESAQNERRAVLQSWTEWEQAWAGRRREAGLPDDATPEAAREIVRAVDEGLRDLGRISDLNRRIGGIDRDREAFERRVRVLCDEVAPEHAEADAERAAAALHVLLGEHENARSRAAQLAEQLSRAQTELEQIESERSAAQAEIDSLVEAAGVESVDRLPEIERRAARVRTLREEIEEIELQVAQVGQGRFDELAEGARDFDRSGAEVTLEEFGEQIEALREERDEAKERIGQRKRELADAETDTDAVLAAEDVELARARVREAALAHAKAKLSAAVVRRAMERYRRLHQDPLLRRANEFFARFTLGSFIELFVDLDERGQAILVGRQRDRVRKRVHEMSTGTREQLFLALRLAAIERYVATSGPVPVIFDDVFLESDEPRSERIFQALGELAATTQVIVLTHHHHLIEVGRRALGERLIVQELPDAAPALRPAAAA